MARLTVLFLFILFQIQLSVGQTLDAARTTAWENAGITTSLAAPSNQVNIVEFGADFTGEISSNAAYSAAISSLNGKAGTIYFPSGEYFFSSTLVVPDSVFLKGASTDVELNF